MMTSDQEFQASIRETVELVARGDIAAFAIPGQTFVEAEGARRFGLVYAALVRAAGQRGRTLVLRWQFDPPGSAAARQRSASNATLLLGALEAHAVDGKLPAAVKVEFEDLGAAPPALLDKLATLGVTAT
ncbi:MAG: hypothetical protein R3B48_10205 [Kofleriaceae bacterium]